jgi:hypothetical protein
MPPLNSDQIKALAPDPASLKSSQGLADTRHWVSLGGNDAVLWGECKGSAKEPYKVRVDLANNGSACTCPSHKFPCKHALGLMLLAAASPKKFMNMAPPDWVADWLEKRAARSQATAKKSEPKADKESRQKEATRRAASRERLAEMGISALERWLKDFARQGLAFAQNAPASFWDEQAKRMVDSQLPGAARLIRGMSTLPASHSDWAEVLLLRVGQLHLLVQAYRRLDMLPEPTRQDVRYILGWNVNQDELTVSTAGILDDWLVAASRTEEDEKTGLRIHVNWLWGKASKRPAQILNFAYRTQPLDTSLVAGLVLCGEMVFFPGSYPLRAVFRNRQIAQDPFTPIGFPTLSVFLNEYATALGKNPWLEVLPVVLEAVTPQLAGQNWLLGDAQGQALPLAGKFASPWELLALSGGYPLTVFGLWDGFGLTPMAAWTGDRYVII